MNFSWQQRVEWDGLYFGYIYSCTSRDLFDASLSLSDLLMFSLNCIIAKSFLNLCTFSSRHKAKNWNRSLRNEKIESCNLFRTMLNWVELNDTLESRIRQYQAMQLSSLLGNSFDFEDKLMVFKLRFMARWNFKNVLLGWKHSQTLCAWCHFLSSIKKLLYCHWPTNVNSVYLNFDFSFTNQWWILKSKWFRFVR